MKQMVVLSGKGGTGKTSVTAALAEVIRRASSPQFHRLILVDADVDAANLELLLSPRILSRESFQAAYQARIDQEHCQGCGICQQICRFDAVHYCEDGYRVDPFACEGCASCYYQCPEQAVSLEKQTVGEWYRSKTRFGPLFHATLRAAQENSGRLVALIKEKAKEEAQDFPGTLLLIDGPPGMGCPVISAVSGVDFALIVTEPSLAGIHDLERVLETTEHFGVLTGVCINKVDISPAGARKIRAICRERALPVLGEIPFDVVVTEAMVAGRTITEFSPQSEVSRSLKKLWYRIQQKLTTDVDVTSAGANLLRGERVLPEEPRV